MAAAAVEAATTLRRVGDAPFVVMATLLASTGIFGDLLGFGCPDEGLL
jgi:hypothetical protein